jgi:hypothetical protein
MDWLLAAQLVVDPQWAEGKSGVVLTLERMEFRACEIRSPSGPSLGCRRTA